MLKTRYFKGKRFTAIASTSGSNLPSIKIAQQGKRYIPPTDPPVADSGLPKITINQQIVKNIIVSSDSVELPKITIYQTAKRDGGSAIAENSTKSLLINGEQSIIENPCINSGLSSVQVFGNTAIATFPSQQNKGILLDGTGDYITIADFYPFSANSDITVEAICYPTTLKRQAIINKRGLISGASANAEWALFFNASNQLQLTTWNTSQGAFLDITGSTTISANQLYHVAFTRQSNTWRLFLNGNLQGSTGSSSGAYAVSIANQVVIGRDIADSARDFQGYIETRILKSCLYTTNFTPPTSLS